MSNEITIFRNEIKKMEGEFSQVLPKQIPTDRFIRTMITAVGMEPSLLQADRKSLMSAGMKAAQDGLLPDGREATFTVFNTKSKDGGWEKKVQYIPMVGGLIKKARQSGEISTIGANIVYKNDHFEQWFDNTGENVLHKPNYTSDRGEMVLVYAFAKLKDGSLMVEVMDIKDVNEIREVSKSKEFGPWKNWYKEMARKTAVRRLCKRLPSNAELESVLRSDEEDYDFKQAEPTDITPTQNVEALTLADKMQVGLDTVMPGADSFDPSEVLVKAEKKSK